MASRAPTGRLPERSPQKQSKPAAPKGAPATKSAAAEAAIAALHQAAATKLQAPAAKPQVPKTQAQAQAKTQAPNSSPAKPSPPKSQPPKQRQQQQQQQQQQPLEQQHGELEVRQLERSSSLQTMLEGVNQIVRYDAHVLACFAVSPPLEYVCPSRSWGLLHSHERMLMLTWLRVRACVRSFVRC
jgi:hypothetical protein